MCSDHTIMKNFCLSILKVMPFMILSLISFSSNGQKDNSLIKSHKSKDIDFCHLQEMRANEKQNSQLFGQLGIAEKELIKPIFNGLGSVELVEKRTEFSRTDRNIDGSFSQTISKVPMHFKHNSKWEVINNQLESSTDINSDLIYVNRTNSFTSYFPNDLSEGLRLELSGKKALNDLLDAKIIFQSVNGDELGQIPMNSSTVVRSDENAVLYKNVYPSIDLNGVVLNGRRKADYIIRDAGFLAFIPEEAEFVVFEEVFNLPQKWTAGIRNGRVFFEDENNRYRGGYDLPKVNDGLEIKGKLFPNEKTLEPIKQENIFFNLTKSGDSFVLQTKVLSSWLKSNSRVFPLVIDPDITANEAGNLRLYNDATFGSPTSIDVVPLATGGVITSVALTAVEWWYTVPAIYFNGYGAYIFANNAQFFPITVTGGAAGTTWAPGAGSYSGATQDFGATSNFNGQSANQSYTFTAGDAGIDALARWNWYTTITYTLPVTPNIVLSGSLSSLTACSGIASSSQSFSVSASNMDAGVTIAAPVGFEVSTDNINFFPSITAGAAGTIASTAIYVRMVSGAVGNFSGNIVCTSANAPTVNMFASASVLSNPIVTVSSSASGVCTGGSVGLSGSWPLTSVHRSDFEDELGNGYTITSNLGNDGWPARWGFGDPYNYGTQIWVLNSNAAGNVDMDETLESTLINTAGAQIVSLTFDEYAISWTTENFDVDVYDGSAWQTVLAREGNGTDGFVSSGSSPASGGAFATQVIDISAYANANMKIRFHYYDANDEYWWLIDNVTVTADGSYAWSSNVGGFSSSINNPTSNVLAQNTNYTLTGTDFQGCIGTATTAVAFSAEPSITTLDDLTAAINSCGETQLSIANDGSGGSGTWVFSGGSVDYVGSSSSTNTSITVKPNMTTNTDITATWTVDAGEVCAGSTVAKILRFSQPSSITAPDSDCYLWGGVSSADPSIGGNWYKWDDVAGLWAVQSSAPNNPTDKINVLIADNGCINSVNTVTLGTVTIANLSVGLGGELSLGSGTVTLNGDIVNAGVINGASGTFEFTTTGNQTISGGGVTSFNNLVLNKTSGDLILNSASTVTGTLTMSNGNIVNGSNILTIGTSSSSTGAISHSLGIITGKVKRFFSNGIGSKFFPIGSSSVLRDVAVDFTSSPGTDQYLTASYNAGVPQNSGGDLYQGLPLTSADGQLIQNYDDEGYWEIVPGSSLLGDDYNASINTTDYNLVLHCNNLTGVDNVTNMDRNLVRVIKSAGPGHTSWESLTHVAVAGTDANFTVSALGSGFSFFGAGTEQGNALPIELVTFYGDKKQYENILNWTTASEINNSFFTIEKSYDGLDFEFVGNQEGSSPSMQIVNYSLTDYNIRETINYYRLKQTDFDGKFVYSKTISIDNRNDYSLKEVLLKTNLLGQEVNDFYSGIVIILYGDGSVRKIYQLK